MNGNSSSALAAIPESPDLLLKKHCYNVPSDPVCIGELYIRVNSTDTECIREFQQTEPDIVPYDCCRDSGVLSFWDDPTEDIYTFEDGQPI